MNTKGISNLHLIIIIIVALVIVGAISALVLLPYLGIVSSDSPLSDPQANPFAPTTNVANILVVGTTNAGVMSALSSKHSPELNNPITFSQDYITTEMLQNYNVVILQGEQTLYEDTVEAIKSYVNSGGALIVIGDSGTVVEGQGNVAGWSYPEGTGIPVPATLSDNGMGTWVSTYGLELRMTDTTHPIVGALDIEKANLDTSGEVFKVTAKGKTIAAIKTTEGEMLPAIIEGGYGYGRVIYFAYDPGLTKSILYTTVKYIAGV